MQKTWENLVTKFKSVYYEDKNKQTGSGAYTIDWPLFDHMKFLVEYIEHRPAVSSLTARNLQTLIQSNSKPNFTQCHSSQSSSQSTSIKESAQSIWKFSASKRSASKNSASCTQNAIKVPKFDDKAIKKQEVQDKQFHEALENINACMTSNSQTLINLLQENVNSPNKADQSAKDSDHYFTIIYSNLQKVQPELVTDCFTEILQELQKLKKVHNETLLTCILTVVCLHFIIF